MEKNCLSICKFRCSEKIDTKTQEEIFMNFYKLDTTGKHFFISQTSICSSSSSSKESSRKKKSYSYFFRKGEESLHVCKSFYLSTLAVSQKVIYGAHEKKEEVSGIIKPDGRGKHNNHYKVTQDEKEKVIAHINSFPVIDSHYSRAKTNKKLLEVDLNIEEMYDLYKEKCLTESILYVKPSYYQYLFNTNLNIAFHVPKTDRCEKYGKTKVKRNEKITITAEEKSAHNTHLAEKVAMRKEKEKDNSKRTSLLDVFDLENVITLPKTEVGSFFIKEN